MKLDTDDIFARVLESGWFWTCVAVFILVLMGSLPFLE